MTAKRGQLVETRKRLLAQIKAHEKLGTADMFADMDGDLKALLERRIGEIEVRIEQSISSDDELALTAGILRSVPGIGPVASTMLIAVPLVTSLRDALPVSECRSLARSLASKLPPSQALRQLHMTAVRCVANAQSEVAGERCAT